MSKAALNDLYFSGLSIKPPQTNPEELPVYNPIPISLGGSDVSIFGGMSISESLFQGGLNGWILLNDPQSGAVEGTEENPTGLGIPMALLVKAGSMIKFSFSSSGDEGDKNNVVDLEFYVYNSSIVSAITPGPIKHGDNSQSITYRLEFASYEGSSVDYKTFDVFTEDWVGRIDEFIKIITSEYMSKTEEVSEEDSGGEAEEIPHSIKNTCQVGPEEQDIVPTYNGVWFKKNQSLYPWGKEKSIPSFHKLISSCVDNAIPALGFQETEDENGIITTERGTPDEKNPSYAFYQSMPKGKWHFVPIGGNDGLITKRYINGSEETGIHTYQITNDENVEKRIQDFRIISLENILDLEQNGAFASQYSLIEPNWSGVYSGITASEEERRKLEATNMYYHDAMSLSSHLKNEKIKYSYKEFFTENEETGETESIGPLLGGNLKNGIENPASSSLIDPVYGYFDQKYLNRPFPTINDDYSSSRNQKYMWQTMFDITELPLHTDNTTKEVGIKYVVDNHRKKCKKGKLAYTILKDIKEQWNRYRHSICCESSAPDDFMALVVGYTGGNSGPKDMIPFGLSGGTLENFYRYSFVEVEVWPKALVPKGISASTFIEGASDELSYYDYLIQQDLNSATGGEREVYISGYAGVTGITFTFGLDQEYEINQEQEFFVIPVNGGKKGLFSAYNTTELINNKAFTGAGINVMGFNYPSGFNLMPIGGMTSGYNDESSPIPSAFMGSIVRMYSLTENDTNTIKTEKDAILAGYIGPEGLSGISGDSCSLVVGLLNEIVGSENIPLLFGGSTLDLSYIESSVDEEGNERQQTKNLNRRDKEERPSIFDNASPSSNKGSLTGVTSEHVVFIFSSENDHDGKCST